VMNRISGYDPETGIAQSAKARAGKIAAEI
jgi:hypothetical protein